MMDICCPWCRKDFEIEDSPWTKLSLQEVVTCPHCGKPSTLEYDEIEVSEPEPDRWQIWSLNKFEPDPKA